MHVQEGGGFVEVECLQGCVANIAVFGAPVVAGSGSVASSSYVRVLNPILMAATCDECSAEHVSAAARIGVPGVSGHSPDQGGCDDSGRSPELFNKRYLVRLAHWFPSRKAFWSRSCCHLGD